MYLKLRLADTWPNPAEDRPLFVRSFQWLRRCLASLGSRTTLVREPFSAEQTRD